MFKKLIPAILAGLFATSALADEAAVLSRHKELEERVNQLEISEKANSSVSSSQAIVDSNIRIPVSAIKAQDSEWLKKFKISLKISRPVPLSELIKAISKQGINITSELPLDRFTYSGMSISNSDAEAALRVLLSTTGLDYSVDGTRKIVTIKPVASKTWYMNLGNRKANFATTGVASTSSGSGTSASSSSSGGVAGPSSQVSASTGTTNVQSQDDFWASLKTELDTRIKVMMPEFKVTPVESDSGLIQGVVTPPTGTPAGAPVAQSQSQDSSNLYVSRTVGQYSINPETGAITVQAPHWVLTDLDSYFKRIQDMYNTDITFEGELITLTVDNVNNEGLDLSAFAKLTSRWGFYANSNPLGGITVTPGSGGSNIPTLSAGKGSSVSSVLAGITSPKDGLSLFNAYLASIGKLNITQKPVISTTSGVPGDFKRTVTKYFNTVSQTSAQGGAGSAAVATQNNLQSVELGTVLRVNPKLDISTGLIRAQIVLVQTTQSGVQNVQQSLTSGNSLTQVTTPIPVISNILYSGEALLKDGDTIIMGGQTEDATQVDRDGIPFAAERDGFLARLFSNKNVSTNHNVFYFALKVTVKKRAS